MRQLKYHEKKLLKKVDFVQYKSENRKREQLITRKYHIQQRDDYMHYNRIAGMITKLVALLRQLDSDDETRIQLTNQLLQKLYDMRVIPVKQSLSQLEQLPASAFVRRRLAVVVSRLKMAQSVREATEYIEQGHIRVGPRIVTDPAFHVTRGMEDFVTWEATSKIRRKVKAYNDQLDDFELQ